MAARVVIVGAGMSGAACARALADRGLAVELFDKGRSVGGRLAQRRIDGLVFDHGAQYLSARDPRLTRLAERWRAASLVADWPAASSACGDPVLVGTPAMNAPVKALLADLPVRTSAHVTRLERNDAGWSVRLADGTVASRFDLLVLAIPEPQAASLLGRSLGPVTMAPCWSALVAPARSLGLERPVHRLDDDTLAWIARNDTKPGRGGAETWTLHATPSWSLRHLEEPGEIVAGRLLARLAAITGVELPPMRHLTAHRWRYALVERPLGRPCIWEPAARLGLCGDWCLGGRVEAAYLSGLALAEAIAG